jgi:UDP:flavonoid glycosyltransferase YjiC (YdhE family)
MRVFITSVAGTGHVFPLVPLARALSARGSDVLWGVSEQAVPLLRAADVPVVAISRDALPSPADALAAFPELKELAPHERPNAMFARLWGGMVAPAMLDALLPVAREWRPDLVICDAAALAGHIVAAELGVPSVTSGFGPLLPAERVAPAEAQTAPLWRSRGLEPRPYAGSYDYLYLDPFPPSLQPQDVAHVPRRQLIRPMGYTGPTTDAPLPLPLGRSDRPLVYLTMGTVFNQPGLFADLIASLRQLDIRLLVTVGNDGDPSLLGEQPDHVRIERYVSQSQLLPHCSVVVSHAGSGTALGAMALGLPQLCLPQGADQFLNAHAIAGAGAGISLSPHEASVDAVSQAVSRLLDEPSFRLSASQIAASIAGMPSPDNVAAVLEQMPQEPQQRQKG